MKRGYSFLKEQSDDIFILKEKAKGKTAREIFMDRLNKEYRKRKLRHRKDSFIKKFREGYVIRF